MGIRKNQVLQFGNGGPLIVDNDAYFNQLRTIGYGKLGPIPYLVICFIAISVFVWFVMTKTRFDCYVYAVGSTERPPG